MTDIAQLRDDFKAVFAHWRKTGELSQDEAARQMREAGAAVQEHMHDADWMRGASDYFRKLVEQIEHEQARAAAIAADVRAERKVAA